MGRESREATVNCQSRDFNGVKDQTQESLPHEKISLTTDWKPVWADKFKKAVSRAVLTEASLSTANLNGKGG